LILLGTPLKSKIFDAMRTIDAPVAVAIDVTARARTSCLMGSAPDSKVARIYGAISSSYVSYLTYDDANRYEDVHNSPDDRGSRARLCGPVSETGGANPFCPLAKEPQKPPRGAVRDELQPRKN